MQSVHVSTLTSGLTKQTFGISLSTMFTVFCAPNCENVKYWRRLSNIYIYVKTHLLKIFEASRLRAVFLRIQLMSVRPVSDFRQARFRFLLSFLRRSTPVARRMSVCSSGSSHVDDALITQTHTSRSVALSSLSSISPLSYQIIVQMPKDSLLLWFLSLLFTCQWLMSKFSEQSPDPTKCTTTCGQEPR